MQATGDLFASGFSFDLPLIIDNGYVIAIDQPLVHCTFQFLFRLSPT
jgi:hypothetical protein